MRIQQPNKTEQKQIDNNGTNVNGCMCSIYEHVMQCEICGGNEHFAVMTTDTEPTLALCECGAAYYNRNGNWLFLHSPE